jgi:hypothetical protein
MKINGGKKSRGTIPLSTRNISQHFFLMRRNLFKPGEYRETLSIYAKYSQTQAMRIIHLHGKVYPAPLENKYSPPKKNIKKVLTARQEDLKNPLLHS